MAPNPLRKMLHRFGIDVCRYPVHTTLPGHLRDVLAREHVTVVLDVGANTGQFGRVLRDEARYRGRIESFEPFPSALAACEHTAASHGPWRVHPFALGDEDRQATLHTYEASEWNSLHALDAGAVGRSGRSLAATGGIDCAVRRLESVWGDLIDPDDVVMLKSDTQGHDVQVLAGAGPRLAEIAVVLVEASVLAFYEGEPRLAEMLEILQQHGFTPSGLFPVTRYRGSLALTTVDVCCVRTPATPAGSGR